ncbi:MAG: FMN-binding protein [Gammaproteobacteria bacterium]|jgi:electron transport complex protein RnfG|nr:FMN-binding protein [Gammaproteobacteria bacterium]|tara:strand:- start:902 stop:1591 length:690 start_codon:yes stop_codon:yes gene_type:complete
MTEIITSDKPAADQDPHPARLIVTLALAGLISGVAIVGIFEATFTTIAENKARELRAAVFKVLPGVSQMQKLAYLDGQVVPLPPDASPEKTIYAGYGEGGKFIGYAIPGEGPGFQDTIKLLYGYKPADRKVVGMEILESRETPGLGDKIYKDAVFVGNFADLPIDPVIEVVKKGRRDSDNQVDAITGATISSRAVVRIINETNVIWLDKLPATGSEPVMPAGSDEVAHD